jgi:hypothetical protein
MRVGKPRPQSPPRLADQSPSAFAPTSEKALPKVAPLFGASSATPKTPGLLVAPLAEQALERVAERLAHDQSLQHLRDDPAARRALNVELSAGLRAPAAVVDPALLRRIEAYRLSFPSETFEVPPSAELALARARAVLELATSGWRALASACGPDGGKQPAQVGAAARERLRGSLAERALVEAHAALSLNPALLEPELSLVQGAAEAFVLLAPESGSAAPALLAASLEAASELSAGRPAATDALVKARTRVISGALDEAERDLAGQAERGLPSDVGALARRWREPSTLAQLPLLRWVANRPKPVMLGASPHLQTIAFALLQLRFPPATPGSSTAYGVLDRTPAKAQRFAWERSLSERGIGLEQVLSAHHKVATDPSEYRQRTLDEVIEDLGPAFAEHVERLGPDDVWLSIGARSASAEQQFYQRRGERPVPRVVALDVMEPSGAGYQAFEASVRHKGFVYLSGQYVEEIKDATFTTLRPKPGGKVVVSDNYAAMAYGCEPHLVLRKLSFLPKGSEVHTTLPYENRCFLDREGIRSAWPEYFEAVEGFKVKSIVPNGDVYQVVLERTNEEFKAPVLELDALELDGGPPERRLRWTGAWVSQADQRVPRITHVRTLADQPPSGGA